MSDILPFCQVKLQYLLDLVFDQSLDDNAFRVAAYLALTHGYVERLATASETSAQALRALEARSTNRMGLRMEGLADCVALLIRSQIESMTALRGLLSEAANLGVIDRQLSESLKQAKAAEERPRRR